MTNTDRILFELPDKVLTSLPTGAVKDIVDHLGHRIASGHYQSGATLPKEDELVESLGVSRTVVREAIKVLCGKGLVRTARRYGSKVCSFVDWNLLDPDVIRWHTSNGPMTARIYSEATLLRYLFEPEAAALAAQKASRRQRETIMAAAQGIRPNFGKKAMIGADYAFHATILQASGSLMLMQLQSMIYATLVVSYSEDHENVSFERVSRRNHVRVAEAIQTGNAEDARSRMQKMLKSTLEIAKKVTEPSL